MVNSIVVILSIILAVFICKIWFSNSIGTMGAYVKYAVIIWFVCLCVVVFIFNKLGLIEIKENNDGNAPQVTQESIGDEDSEGILDNSTKKSVKNSTDNKENDGTENSDYNVIDDMDICDDLEIDDINGYYLREEEGVDFVMAISIIEDGSAGALVLQSSTSDEQTYAELSKVSDSLYTGVTEKGVELYVSFCVDEEDYLMAELAASKEDSIVPFYKQSDLDE